MLCGDLIGWKPKRQGMYVYTWLIHLIGQRKPTQSCKAIIDPPPKKRMKDREVQWEK